jgi:amino acid adenylation domain-containing protein
MNSASVATANRPEAFTESPEAEQSIPERFAQIVARHGDHIAVSANSEEWTYAELDERSNALAVQILERPGANRQPVALLMEHGGAVIAAILAVLKTGKTYLALDPSHPIERLSAMLADSRGELLITDQTNAALANSLAGGKLSILRINLDFITSSTGMSFSAVSPEAGAWLMYTSGSTGAPKGVWEDHRGVVHSADVYSKLIQLTPDDRLSLLTSCSLPASATPLFTALLNGATLCPFHVRSQGIERLAVWLCKRAVTVYHSVPTIFRQLARATNDNRVFASLRLVRLGGEPVLRGDIQIFRQRCPDHCRLMNALASTETGLICAAMIDKHTVLPNGRIPVGRAVRDVDVFLENEQGQPAGNGRDGRIGVRSAYLRKGYWLRPEATAEKFGTDPRAPNTRIFITNDLGRFLPDGNLEHLGRADRVVKIHGLRVDLAALEAALNATDLVEEAVVTAVQNSSDGYRLVIFIVPRGKTDGSPHACRRALQQSFPVPSHFVMVRELPVLASGKIDRVQLSEKAAQTLATQDQPQSDADALDLQLVRLWEKVLDINAIGTTDDFFALGGDSLAAATMLAAVEKFFGVTLPVSALLEAPTVEKLAELIRKGGWSEANRCLVALQLRGTEPALYCVPGAGCEALELRELARHLGVERPIFAFQPQGLDGSTPYLRSVEEMAAHYICGLRRYQPRGPYFLCGRSFGGVVAFEMARRLTADGDEVRFLALLDSHGGEYPKRRKDFALRNKLKLVILRRLPIGPDGVVSWRFLKTLLKCSADLSFRCARRFQAWCQRQLIRLGLRWNFRRLPRQYRLRFIYLNEVCLAARRRYKLQPFPGKIDLFRVEHQPSAELFESDPLLGWGGMAAGGINVHNLPGYHADHYGEPGVAILAQKLKACLAQAKGDQS